MSLETSDAGNLKWRVIIGPKRVENNVYANFFRKEGLEWLFEGGLFGLIEYVSAPLNILNPNSLLYGKFLSRRTTANISSAIVVDLIGLDTS